MSLLQSQKTERVDLCDSPQKRVNNLCKSRVNTQPQRGATKALERKLTFNLHSSVDLHGLSQLGKRCRVIKHG